MFDEQERLRIEEKLTAWADRRVPIQLRDKLVLQFRFESNSIVLFEKRPHFQGRGWTESPVARFRFVGSRREWELSCRRANERWCRYEPLPVSTSLDALLAEVDDDPTCIFWG